MDLTRCCCCQWCQCLPVKTFSLVSMVLQVEDLKPINRLNVAKKAGWEEGNAIASFMVSGVEVRKLLRELVNDSGNIPKEYLEKARKTLSDRVKKNSSGIEWVCSLCGLLYLVCNSFKLQALRCVV